MLPLSLSGFARVISMPVPIVGVKKPDSRFTVVPAVAWMPGKTSTDAFGGGSSTWVTWTVT